MDAQPFVNGVGIEMMPICGGTFFMGSLYDEPCRRENEGPMHLEALHPFYISKTQITQSQFSMITHINPSYFSRYGGGACAVRGWNTDGFPVESVSMEEAAAFCERLTEHEQIKETGYVYRLPTEVEWEYACRGLTATPFHTGDTLLFRDANISGEYPFGGMKKGSSFGHTVAVGEYKPNAYGLHDMHGNVWELCAQPYYLYDSPKESISGTAVMRGGSWRCYARFCRSAYRCISRKDAHYYDVGFRVVYCRGGGDITCSPS